MPIPGFSTGGPELLSHHLSFVAYALQDRVSHSLADSSDLARCGERSGLGI